MSKLARSLLALAALLAAADAACTSNVHGNDTDHVELLGPFGVSSFDAEKGKVINIEDSCGFGKPVGVTINACNSHSSRTFTDMAPPGLSSNMTHVEVRCEPRACSSGIYVQIIQYLSDGHCAEREQPSDMAVSASAVLASAAVASRGDMMVAAAWTVR
ncbi:uncharacterized protein LOC134663375 [Cydia fagiglandana]|uniref:uncharacterized protein LOC134663375 n=1 Tax=Cydia fagiglandana TaxID=1458189 RepID=UPI002FEDE9D3